MKIQAIGDLHGHNTWRDLIDMSCDKIIFLGDYVDDWPKTTDTKIISNLLDIIEVKTKNPLQVELILGNHDEQYYNNYIGCSGHRSSYAVALNSIFKDNKDLFQIAYQQDNYIWTHAGISTQWYKGFLNFFDEPPTHLTLSEQLNLYFNSSRYWYIAQVGKSRGGLRGDVGGPFWADKSELIDSNGTYLALEGYHQIVGHNKIADIATFEIGNSSITFCDCLWNTKTTKIIEI